MQNLRAVLEKSRIAPAHIAAVRLTGQMHGLTLLDTHGDLLCPCILWNDQRTAAQCAAITQRVGPARVLQLTGNPVPTGLAAPMLLWVRGNEPNLYRRVADLLLPKDYTRYKLTGGFFSDMSGSFGTSFQGRRKYAVNELAGYADHKKKVTHRLIVLVW